MRVFVLLTLLVVLLTACAPVAAADLGSAVASGPVCAEPDAVARPWAVSFGSTSIEPATPVLLPPSVLLPAMQTTTRRRVVAVDYSEAYKVRAKIHKYASLATLPLFGAMYWVGQDLYDHPGESESKKGLHGALAGGTGVLFGVNTITGVWNLWDGRKDPNHRARRMTHGILMLLADAGFAATGAMAPDSEGYQSYDSWSNDRKNHRTVALTSMGVATASYLMMLLWRN